MNYIDIYKNNTKHSSMLPDRVNTNNGDSFELIKVVKSGGNGVVFSAKRYDKYGIAEACAVKFLRQLDDTRVDRFKNEVRIISNLSHDGIVKYFGDGSINICSFNVPWLAMELGGDNFRVHVESNGPFSKEKIVQIGLQICDALYYFHGNGYVHRDIKPDNFVWRQGGNIKAMMIDFGIAKKIKDDYSARPLDSFTQHKEFVGPVFYSSTELISYAKDKSVLVDHRSDLFQIGKLLWFLATNIISSGVPSSNICPFGGKLQKLVVNLIQDNPEDRPQNALEVKKCIECL